MPDLQPIVKRLDEMIREAIPGLLVRAQVEEGLLRVGGGRVDHRGGRLRRLRERRLPRRCGTRPPAAAWGHCDRSRYVKVKTLEETQEPELQGWIEQAARVPGWR
jgi:hypothetical protein